MGSQSVSVMVEGGKATAAPPIGPALSPLGLPVGKVVEEINKQTSSLKGMQVPVKIIVGPNKTFTIEVGKPPIAALIRKEAKVEAGSAFAGQEWIGNISMEQVKLIAKTKFGYDEENYVKQVLGTCRSMGISIGEEGKALIGKKREIKKVEAVAAGAPAAPGTPPVPAATGAPPISAKGAPPAKKEEKKKRKIKKGK